MSINFQRYNDLNNQLVSEAISCTPPTWKNGTLTIDCDGKAIHYKLRNDADENKAVISDKLKALCEELYVTMRKDGNVWTECVLDFAQKAESWGFNFQFRYPPSSQPPTGPPPVPAPPSSGPPPLP